MLLFMMIVSQNGRKSSGRARKALSGLVVSGLLLPFSLSSAGAATGEPYTAEALTEKVRSSITVVTVLDRNGEEEGIGTGFVVDESGLVATSLHVIGAGREVFVETADKMKYPVKAIHAFDRKFDLVVLEIEAQGLPALSLGDSDNLKQGSSVMAVGNPHGYEFSVVRGEVSVVSAMREVDNLEMIQLAIPLEPGNSGGPLLDMYGRVQGVLTMKSAVTRNLGFAMPVNHLKRLLERPNPVPMERWTRIGALDEDRWEALFGARWTQRAGKIKVTGWGSGLEGRSLCLARELPPEPPYEVGVSVKLDDEKGAAGLVFASDGKHRHYGFYPTGGRLRLSRFEGPNVFTWTPLKTIESEHYLPGRWNDLKVRFGDDGIRCYVNGRLVIESRDAVFRKGRVGMAKFRNTEAEFRQFQVGGKLAATRPSPEFATSLKEKIGAWEAETMPEHKVVELLQDQADFSRLVLVEQAREMEQQAKRFRRLAEAVHLRSVQGGLIRLFEQDEKDIDLLHAALLLAKLDNPELDVDAYRSQVERMALEIRSELGEDSSDREKLRALSDYLFSRSGFHGSRSDYHNPANSYLNQVLDDREGLPITLSVLFIELSRRLEIDRVVGVPLPGHFVVRYLPQEGAAPLEFIDVFDGGRKLSLEEAAEKVFDLTRRELKDQDLLPATKRQIVIRMLRNLIDHTFSEEAPEETLRYMELMAELDPEDPFARWGRGMLRYRTGNAAGAKADFEWLLDHRPAGIDLNRIHEIYRQLP